MLARLISPLKFVDTFSIQNFLKNEQQEFPNYKYMVYQQSSISTALLPNAHKSNCLKKTLQSHTVILFSYFFSKCENTPSSFLRGMGKRSVGSSAPKKFVISQINSTNKYKENQAQGSIFQCCESIMKLTMTFPGLTSFLLPGQQAVLPLHQVRTTSRRISTHCKCRSSTSSTEREARTVHVAEGAAPTNIANQAMETLAESLAVSY